MKSDKERIVELEARLAEVEGRLARAVPVMVPYPVPQPYPVYPRPWPYASPIYPTITYGSLWNDTSTTTHMLNAG